MTDVGYARVSTADQDPQLQVDALNEAGVEKIFTEHASGAKADRPELARTLEYLRTGDTLVVWKLDRLGRSLKHLIEIVNGLNDRGIEFRSLTEGFDTHTAMGRMVFQFMGALAEFERELIRERTLAGLAAARANGRHGGRRRVLTMQDAARIARRYAEGVKVAELARIHGCSRATVYRALDGAA